MKCVYKHEFYFTFGLKILWILHWKFTKFYYSGQSVCIFMKKNIKFIPHFNFPIKILSKKTSYFDNHRNIWIDCKIFALKLLFCFSWNDRRHQQNSSEMNQSVVNNCVVHYVLKNYRYTFDWWFKEKQELISTFSDTKVSFPAKPSHANERKCPKNFLSYKFFNRLRTALTVDNRLRFDTL